MIKFYELDRFIDSFVDLEFDGDETDKRLHFGHFTTWYNNEEDYIKAENELNSFQINRADYTVYLWNDVSGYDYWKDEPNYVQCSVFFKNNEISEKELTQFIEDIETAYNKAEDIADNSNIEEYYELLNKGEI